VAEDMIAEDAEGEVERVDGEEQERSEDQSLDETVGGHAFGDVAVFGGEIPVKDQEEDEETVKEMDEIHGEGEFGEVAGLMVAFGRESVCGDFGGGGCLCGLSRRRRGRRLLDCWRGGLCKDGGGAAEEGEDKRSSSDAREQNGLFQRASPLQ